jgi:hypothetical protein
MDWSNPKSWKAPAALIEHWQTIPVGGVAIAGTIWGLVRKSFTLFAWLWSKIPRRIIASVILERPFRFECSAARPKIPDVGSLAPSLDSFQQQSAAHSGCA